MENHTKNTMTIEQPRSSMEMSTANPLRICSSDVAQNLVIAQMLCGHPPTISSKGPLSRARPTVSAEEDEQERIRRGQVLKAPVGLSLGGIRLFPLLR